MNISVAPRMLIAAAILLVGPLSELTTADPAAVASSAEQRPAGDGGITHAVLNGAALDDLLRPVFINTMADAYVAGAAVVVVHGDRVVYQAGFGRREVFREVPVDPERTIFRIGSITKVLTAVAVMQLVDRDQVDLDADVNDYLTRLQVPDAFGEPVRVRHLLTHTSGLDQIGLGRHAASAAKVKPLAEFLSGNLIRIRPPEEVSTYDTYGITLAGLLIEEVSGLTYEDYLLQKILGPLNMPRSGIAVPKEFLDEVATGYEFLGQREAMDWEYMNTDPASTVNGTVTDMANFMIMMLNDGSFKGREVLKPETVRAILTQQYTNHPDQPGYGYGFWENRDWGIAAWSHGGSMTGFGSFLYLIPQHDVGVYVAYNQESGRLADVVISAFVAALIPGSETRPMRERMTTPIEPERFAGTYANSMYNHGDPTKGWRRRPFEVETTDDGIIFGGATAYPVGPLTFQREDGRLLTFRENERGEIVYMFVRQQVYEKLSVDGTR